MKSYLMTGIAALTLCAGFTSCSHDDFELFTQSQIDKAKYDQAFLAYVDGKIASNQDWGFGSATRGITRSQSAPEVADINVPYSEEWVAEYLATAKEPNSENVVDNYDNSSWETASNLYSLDDYWNAPEEDRNKFHNTWPWDDEFIAWVLANHPTWIVDSPDETYVRNFKITGTWNGGIGVAASEGADYARTIVVTGTWNLTEDQKIGGSGKVIVAKGGTINVEAGASLQFVNEGRFVVLPGGTVTGKGTVEVTNGNSEGLEGYNGGTIEVGKFNNNFGKFYNYGTFKADLLAGGAGLSNFYNHSLVVIGGSYENSNYLTANTRVFNACQFYCTGDVRLRNYEGVMGSSLIVDGELMFSGGTDGTSDPSYVALAAGALVKCGELYNNGTSWDGPTTNGYAVLSTGKITFLNWEQDHPENGGYFANNIYVQADDWTNAPGGNGMGGENAADKFAKVANKAGNGNVTVVEKGDNEVIPADGDYKKGVSGCTPGFKIKENNNTGTEEYNLRIIAEDLSAQEAGDFDFNDVVFDVKYDANNAVINLLAAGGTLPLRIKAGDNSWEVHNEFNVSTGTMVNTNATNGATKDPVRIELGIGVRDASEANTKIIIQVEKSGEWQTLTAVKGEPAAKLAVGTDFQWLDERKSIKGEYEFFLDWVNNNNLESEWWK